MIRKVLVPTGNLAWRYVGRAGQAAVRPVSHSIRPGSHDSYHSDYELVQEVVEVELSDDDEVMPTYTGAVEWRPIPILPASPPPPTREDIMQYSTVVTNTETMP